MRCKMKNMHDKLFELMDGVADLKAGQKESMVVNFIENIEGERVTIKTDYIKEMELVDNNEYRYYPLVTYGDLLNETQTIIKNSIAVLQGMLMAVDLEMNNQEFSICPQCSCDQNVVDEKNYAKCKQCNWTYKLHVPKEEVSVGTNHHELKCWPEYFQKVWDGQKPFEVRNNDRNFEANDSVTLMEWDPKTENYTGRKITALIGTVITEAAFCRKGQCVFSLLYTNNIKNNE